MSDSPNAKKIENQVDAIRRLRLAPDRTLPIGWGDDDVPVTTANALAKAGLARINGKANGAETRTVTAL